MKIILTLWKSHGKKKMLWNNKKISKITAIITLCCFDWWKNNLLFVNAPTKKKYHSIVSFENKTSVIFPVEVRVGDYSVYSVQFFISFSTVELKCWKQILEQKQKLLNNSEYWIDKQEKLIGLTIYLFLVKIFFFLYFVISSWKVFEEHSRKETFGIRGF